MKHERMTDEKYRTAAEIAEVVRRFETCDFGPDEFRHREHLVVALWYLSESSIGEATRRMRDGLYSFLAHHGVDRQKYHETITLFWFKRVRALFEERKTSHSLVEIANEVVTACHEPKEIYDYYSRELLASEAARAGWAEPDLRPLDFQSKKG